ncbi:hypothetical protein CDV36_010098 [Fusarium kuroshium]|uniref:MalT-like TPR region domain-containing protein n=1 Tax=Fusarium kuroshium TaxID=2010991 RepID=A0A3M2RZ94_9HYPO|nr:hypothetical protein CDV36_010098 [Fusarium kuroshium]
MDNFMRLPSKRTRFGRVHVKKGPKRDPGKRSRKRERVEVLFLSCSPSAEWKTSVEASARILDHYSVPYRSGYLRLDIDTPPKDVDEPEEDTLSQLRTLMESRPRLKTGKLMRKRSSRAFLIVDENAASMVKKIISRPKSRLRADTIGLVFLSRATKSSEKVESKRKPQQKFDRFDSFSCTQDAALQATTWILGIDQHATSTECDIESFISSLIEPIQAAIRQLTDAATSQSHVQPMTPARRNPHMETKLYSEYRNEQRRRDEVPAESSSKQNLGIVTPALEAYTQLDWEGKTQFLHLRDHAEACLSNSHLKHALVAFKRCLEMNVPWDDARWELKGSLALVQICLGDYAKAEEELQTLLGEIPTINLSGEGEEIVTNIRRETTFRHALALSRLERHDEVLKCLSTVTVPRKSKQSSSQAETALMLQAKVSRLRAFSRASLGFQDLQNLKDDLLEADHCSKGLSDLLAPDRKKRGRVDMFKYRWTEILTSLSKSRVIMLQGDYIGALQVLQPALRDAILKIGETDVLTLEATLLNCHLQILTGQVRLGRQSCERCADVILETLGPEHNLALEAEYLLIAAAQAEGLLTLALDDSKDLCGRAESRVDLGPKHPSTLKYRSQLGDLHLQHGNYLDAESILTSVWTDSEGVWSPVHPSRLRIQSQLALARYHLGKLEMAEVDICTALRGQLQTYLRMEARDLWQTGDCIGEFLEKRRFLQDVSAIYSAPRSDRDDDRMPHPDILLSFLTWGKVLLRKEDLNLKLVHDIFWLVRASARKQLGPSHELSLAASFAMGEVFSTKGRMASDDAKQQKYYLKAASCYNFVVCPESSTDNPDYLLNTLDRGQEGTEGSRIITRQPENHHPIALHARQESLVVTILGCGEVKDDIKYVQSCKKELEFILAAQENLLGWNHPYRLKTLFSILALQVGSDESKEDVLKTQEELMGCLKGKDVREQRFLECLLMEEKMAGVLCGRRDLSKRCRVIADDIEAAVLDSEAIDPSLRNAAESIYYRTDTMLRRLES